MAPKKQVQVKREVIFGRPSNTLKMGLVGLPNVGKSSTFNLMSEMVVPAENFPFCTIEPHETVVKVEDERFHKLVDMYKPKSEIGAVLRVWDIAGLVPGAHQGEGLGNAFLSNIAAVDGIYHVCRVFQSEDITHTEGDVDPCRDLGIIHNELIQKDLAWVSDRLTFGEKRFPASSPEYPEKVVLPQKLYDILTNGDTVLMHADKFTSKEIDAINEMPLITVKPIVYILNLSKKDFIRGKNKHLPKIKEWIDAHGGGPIIPYSVEFEEAYREAEDKAAFLEEAGRPLMLDKIIKTGYSHLGLVHFFTCGPQEVRAWTVRANSPAPDAAAVIHTDFKKFFISVEICKYDNLMEYGSELECKKLGKWYKKGKDYIIEDADICHFLHNAK